MRKIARFGALMRLPGEHLVNFSDCPSKHPLRPSVLAYLGDRFEDPVCRELAQIRYQTLLAEPIDLHGGRSDFTFFSSLLLCCPSEHPGQDVGVDLSSEGVFFEELNVVVSHSEATAAGAWHFAAKAGHNDESHNHNDCGSYILNVGNVPVIKEIGQPEYVKEYFDISRRYEFLAARTQGHSLATINGCEQVAGESYTSQIVRHDEDANGLDFSMELSGCYPDAAKCRRYTRQFRLNKQLPELEVLESFELGVVTGLETAVITTIEPQVEAGQVILSAYGTAVALVPNIGTLLGSVERLNYAAHSGDMAFVFRILLVPVELAERVTLGYRITCVPTSDSV